MQCSFSNYVYFQLYQVFDASHNQITRVSDRTLQEGLGLQQLLLAHNDIEMIHSEAFPMQRQLRVLDLSNNNLTTMDPSALEYVERSLEVLRLEGMFTNNVNPISCRPFR